MWILIILIVLLSVAFMTLIERKLMGHIQKRKGPNVVGYKGLLQPISDGIKLLLKESIIPLESNKILFIGGPLLFFYLSLINWLVMPLDNGVAITRIYHGILFL
jgi:NADH:ubiquinone oxidoreductase subunit H